MNTSGSRLSIGPSARPNAFIERVWGEISAVRPDNRSNLRIDHNRGKALGLAGLLKDRAVHAIEDADLAAQSVGKSQPKDAVTDDFHFSDFRG